MKKYFAILALLLAGAQASADNWMSRLPDNQYVATVSIPGTHDTATGSGWASGIINTGADRYSKTQELTIEQQWNLGIRAFDFRPAEQNGYMSCNHGVQETKLKFEEVLTQLCGFLDANPSEFILIHLLKGTGDNYISRVKEVLARAEYQDYFIEFKTNLTVGEMRKHILIISRDWENWDSQTPIAGGCFGWWSETGKVADTDKTLSNSDAYILSPSGKRGKCVMQDLANTSGSGALDRKLELMTILLDWSTTHQTTNAGNIYWVFNFASGYDKETSFFGQKLSLSEGYRDNAKHTNKLVSDYLKTHSGPTGVILMDYVGCEDTYGTEAVEAIISNNFRERVNAYGQATELAWLHRSTPSVADYNNDGLMDIYFGGEVWDGDFAWDVTGRLLTQQADRSFLEENTRTSGEVGEHGLPASVYGYSRWFDYDNDGNLDFLCTTRNDNNLQDGELTLLYHNQGEAGGYRFTRIGTPLLNGYNEHADGYNSVNNSSISFADYDLDGFVDIVQQSYTGEGRESVVFHNNGDGTFRRAFDLTPMTHGSVTFGDLDNDGLPDIVATGWEDGNHYCEFYIYRNNGDGTLETLRMTDRGFTGMCNSDVCLVDLDGDGLLDIVACGNNGGARTDIYMNQGDFSFTHVTDHGIAGADEASIRAVDINYDGRPDLIITGKTGAQRSDAENDEGEGLRIYLQREDGTFDLQRVTGLPVMGQGGLALGDLTGRGGVDAMVMGNGVAGVYTLSDAPSKSPSIPTSIKATVDDDRMLTVTWRAGSETGLAANRLSYNVYVQNNETGAVSMLVPANLKTGKFKTLQDMQNLVHGRLSYSVRLGEGESFTVGVQTVDPALSPSRFYTKKFTVTPTGIEEVREAASTDEAVYDLSGRRMGRAASVAEAQSLRKGVYIYKGKKTIVK